MKKSAAFAIAAVLALIVAITAFVCVERVPVGHVGELGQDGEAGAVYVSPVEHAHVLGAEIALIYLIGIPLQVLAVIFFSPWKKPFLHNVTGNN